MTAYTVFGNATPAAPNEADEDGSYGTVIDIEAGVTGTVTHARWRFPNTLPSGQVTWHLYDLTNAVALAEHTFTAPVAGQWVQGLLSGPGIQGPVEITGPRRLVAWVGTPDRYVATGGFFNGHAEANGPLTAPATETTANGRFGGDPVSVPSGTFNGGCYFADLVFNVPAPPGEGAAELGLEYSLTGAGFTPVEPQGTAALGLVLTLASTGAAPTAGQTDTGVCGWGSIDPAVLGVCSDWADRPEAVRVAAMGTAALFLWAATGRQYGICPVTIRPSQPRGGAEDLYQDYPVLPGHIGMDAGGPYLYGGRWYNAGCGAGCCGDRGCGVMLRGPVGSVISVVVAGEVVEESAYRVDVQSGAYLLVRADGSCWPTCAKEPGDFEVTYGIGVAVPAALTLATAQLACEYAKHLTGGACALPARMTRLSRQGVEVEVDTGSARDGSTGLRQVDDVIALLNPSKRQSPPMLLSPDLPGNCDGMTVWGA